MQTDDCAAAIVSREERIRRRALAIFKARGGRPGSAIIDWLEAEKQILDEEDRAVDEASEESFPASDSPAY